MDASSSWPCLDLLLFTRLLQASRKTDDLIVHKLNQTVLTPSFKTDPAPQCEKLYTELQNVYQTRETQLKRCLAEAEEQVMKLQQAPTVHVTTDTRGRKRTDHINPALTDAMDSVQMMQQELRVERLIRSQNLKVFKERCGIYFFPTDKYKSAI